MFFRILKKDLKRKKTMNIILLLFVILCAMFASAAVNNILAVTGGIEQYFDAADVPDVTVMTATGSNDVEEQIRALPSVSEVRAEHWMFVLSSKSFELHGRKLNNFVNPAGMISEKEMGIRYFDAENRIIGHVEQGSFYANSPFLQNLDIAEGDAVTLTVGETKLTLTYKGRFKGALFNSLDTANPYLLLNAGDYDTIGKEDAAHMQDHTQLYVRTSDPDAVRELARGYDDVSVTTREESKNIYLYDMIAAYIMMIISVVLMITAFVVLRFTIGFTISEEFREIGVMKAVGIDNGSIRCLYIVKYLAISVIGALIGFAGSIPLTDLMLKTVSQNMVLGGQSSKLMGIVSSAAVVAVILLFCYGCTRKVRKLSPIDAVRSGQTGERFGQKSLLHLGRSKLPSTGFLALNDVLSAPKQFAVITVIFTLCILLIALMSNFALTLRNEKILWLFDVPASDAHIMETEWLSDVFAKPDGCREAIADTEKLLRDNGMPASCSMTITVQAETTHGDRTAKIFYDLTKGSIGDMSRMDEGYAPQKNDEIAMTVSALNELDAKIGDHVKAVIGGKEYDFLITGRYSTFGVRSAKLCRDFEFGEQLPTGYMGLQIRFDGNPDQATIDRNIEKIKDLIHSEKVYSTSDFIANLTGISDTLTAIKKLMMLLTVIVTALIVVLMERSFISKEKSEIALMKAVGIRNSSIIAQHALRFVIVSVLAVGLALVVLMPLSNVMMNQICLLIGDVSGIVCVFDPVEIFVICPAILIGVTVIGSFLTALYTKTIKASDTASIE